MIRLPAIIILVLTILLLAALSSPIQKASPKISAAISESQEG